MTGTNELSQGLARDRDQFFVEGDTLVTLKQRRSDCYLATSAPERCRDVGDLIASPFTLGNAAAQAHETIDEEGSDEVRLELPRLSSLHVFLDKSDIGGCARWGILVSRR